MKTKEELRIELNSLTEEFLKTSDIKYLSRKKKKSHPPIGLITEYKYDTTEIIV
ncbi:hypothetical protein EVB99_054 [Rhizobium phage RHph_N3_19]|nr:hypothetical protein EVB99_054 [Rhizobium phage RHph_N3_19]